MFTAPLRFSFIIRSKCDAPSPYISKPPLYEIVKLAHHQSLVNNRQQIENHERVTQEDEKRLTDDGQTKFTIPDNYKDPRGISTATVRIRGHLALTL